MLCRKSVGGSHSILLLATDQLLAHFMPLKTFGTSLPTKLELISDVKQSTISKENPSEPQGTATFTAKREASMGISECMVIAMIAFHAGALAKTIIDGCFYRKGVIEGYRVSQSEIDADLNGARLVLKEAGIDGYQNER